MSDNNVMISHSSTDVDLAQSVSSLISRCSLQQIKPWFSSDRSGTGGMQAGDRWFDRIRSELSKSKACIVLLTPTSVESAWVQFEAGFGAASGKLEIIPILFGIRDISLIPDPISHWQIFRTDNNEDCASFLEKLFVQMGVHFDGELLSTQIEEFVKSYNKNMCKPEKSSASIDESGEIDRLRGYLDKKFFDLFQTISSKETNFSHYNFEVMNAIDGQNIEIRIDINTSFGDALHEIYYRIADHVEPFKYLVQWILRDIDSGRRFILREMGDDIPASIIFTPGRRVALELLKEPYIGTQSELGGGFSSPKQAL